MLARTYITYVAVAAVALVSVAQAAPAVTPEAPNLDKVPTLNAVAEEVEGPATLPVPKEFYPLCCIHKIKACCFGEHLMRRPPKGKTQEQEMGPRSS
ncbi:hypothetical protein DFQ27_006100 [Actinomortierella ambigua]|uniref:Uncharacterized protein n=1 Tax=Actinomortierella ambigua TaxID=1343610 RepID=A0A9P6U1Z6_9FUNG|nr:hypothetical protein DFQ27_006100 [Actinomortierella ambigua]